jgi:2-succinyl-5-enolpyruvyl-6-hydroxy-3-cyclohexene-1-carboxylate synthase
MYGLDYFEANDEITLQQQYSAFLNQNEKPSILEVFTPEKENNGILLEFFRQLK